MFFESGSALLRTLIVGSLAYVALVFLLRFSGKRTLSKPRGRCFRGAAALCLSFYPWCCKAAVRCPRTFWHGPCGSSEQQFENRRKGQIAFAEKSAAYLADVASSGIR
jgi:hypothetical protein